jgi:hypothetical protein
MTSRKKFLLLSPLILLGFLLFIALGGVLVMQLWNWLLPSLFGWRQISFWEALGLLLLCRILFGGLGVRGGGPHSRVRGRIAERMAERWEHMSTEERERLRQRLLERCGIDRAGSESRAE